MFRLISMEDWPRRPYFEHYTQDTPCTYSICRDLDITNLRRRHLRLYPTMLYLLTEQVNRYPQFRTDTDAQGRLGIHDSMHPCYTIFHPETETFSNLWTEFDPDYRTFCSRYEEDQRIYGNLPGFAPKPDTPANIFPVSMIPWTTFTGFTLHLDKGSGYYLPIFTMGRFTETAEGCTLPLALQVHHGVCDGFHTARFLEGLQQRVASFAPDEEEMQ